MLQAGLNWDKQIGPGIFWYRRPTTTSIYIIYIRDPQIWTILAEFSSNPNQRHVLKSTRKSQVGEFDQGWS